jgi:hypothetical protein
MKNKWEYDFITAGCEESLRDLLNKAGQKGWEVISFDYSSRDSIAWLKRPLSDPPPGCEHL